MCTLKTAGSCWWGVQRPSCAAWGRRLAALARQQADGGGGWCGGRALPARHGCCARRTASPTPAPGSAGLYWEPGRRACCCRPSLPLLWRVWAFILLFLFLIGQAILGSKRLEKEQGYFWCGFFFFFFLSFQTLKGIAEYRSIPGTFGFFFL